VRLTPQERRVAGFLLIILVISLSIRLVERYILPDSMSQTQAQQSTSDSLFLAKTAFVDSLVRAGSAAEESDSEVKQMVESQKSMKVAINSADRSTLMQLPRIGPAMSKRIIAHREKNGYFKSFKDLREVKGVGPATIEKLRPLITFNIVRP